MAINDVIDNALKTKWTTTDNFDVIISNPRALVAAKWDEASFGDIIRKSLISIDVPVLTSPETDVVLGGERRIGVKIHESFRFTIKFRDFLGGELRRFFQGIWIAQQYEYFDNIKTSVEIISNMNDSSFRKIFKTNDALITSVSSIQFDYSSTQIAEFDVTFISNKFSDELVSEFGSSKFVESLGKS